MADTKLTAREQERIAILTAAIERTITNNKAAKQLRLSVRQVQRAKKALREKGKESVIHGLKGKTGNHHITETVKEKTLAIIKEKYADFKPSFATEKLAENHNMSYAEPNKVDNTSCLTNCLS